MLSVPQFDIQIAPDYDTLLECNNIFMGALQLGALLAVFHHML